MNRVRETAGLFSLFSFLHKSLFYSPKSIGNLCTKDLKNEFEGSLLVVDASNGYVKTA